MAPVLVRFLSQYTALVHQVMNKLRTSVFRKNAIRYMSKHLSIQCALWNTIAAAGLLARPPRRTVRDGSGGSSRPDRGELTRGRLRIGGSFNPPSVVWVGLPSAGLCCRSTGAWPRRDGGGRVSPRDSVDKSPRKALPSARFPYRRAVAGQWAARLLLSHFVGTSDVLAG